MYIVLLDPMAETPDAGWPNIVTRWYDDEAVAEAEARRLATKYQRRFFVMEAIGGAVGETKCRPVYHSVIIEEREARLAARDADPVAEGEGLAGDDTESSVDPSSYGTINLFDDAI